MARAVSSGSAGRPCPVNRPLHRRAALRTDGLRRSTQPQDRGALFVLGESLEQLRSRLTRKAPDVAKESPVPPLRAPVRGVGPSQPDQDPTRGPPRAARPRQIEEQDGVRCAKAQIDRAQVVAVDDPRVGADEAFLQSPPSARVGPLPARAPACSSRCTTGRSSWRPRARASLDLPAPRSRSPPPDPLHERSFARRSDERKPERREAPVLQAPQRPLDEVDAKVADLMAAYGANAPARPRMGSVANWPR